MISRKELIDSLVSSIEKKVCFLCAEKIISEYELEGIIDKVNFTKQYRDMNKKYPLLSIDVTNIAELETIENSLKRLIDKIIGGPV